MDDAAGKFNNDVLRNCSLLPKMPSIAQGVMEIQMSPVQLQFSQTSMGPFISPQLAQCNLEEIQFVTQLIENGNLRLTRIPSSDMQLLQEPDYHESVQYMLNKWGQRSKAQFRVAFAWLTSVANNRVIVTARCEAFDEQFRYRVHIGKWNLIKMVSLFDRLELKSQCLIPFFKRNYPQELFVFERGPHWKPGQRMVTQCPSIPLESLQ